MSKFVPKFKAGDLIHINDKKTEISNKTKLKFQGSFIFNISNGFWSNGKWVVSSYSCLYYQLLLADGSRESAACYIFDDIVEKISR